MGEKKTNVEEMSKEEILRRQLELLAEASTQCDASELIGLTHAMVALTNLLN